jgi:hypothetical protein
VELRNVISISGRPNPKTHTSEPTHVDKKNGNHSNRIVTVRFHVLTAVVMRTSIVWDIMRCSMVTANRRFGGTECFHHQVRGVSQERNRHKADRSQSSAENGGDTFLWNVCWLSPNHMTYCRRQNSSQYFLSWNFWSDRVQWSLFGLSALSAWSEYYNKEIGLLNTPVLRGKEVSETLEISSTLTRLIAHDDFGAEHFRL